MNFKVNQNLDYSFLKSNKMKKIIHLLLIPILMVPIISNAQIGIGTTSPDASAILDLFSTTKGFLLPRMTTEQQQAMINPAIGLIVFNTTTGAVETNKGNSFGTLWVGATGAMGITGPIGPIGLTGPAGSLSTVGAGVANSSTTEGATIGGGSTNTACGINSTVVGGTTNVACGENSIVGGGSTNQAMALNSSIVGGTTNHAFGVNSFVGGGTTNLANALNTSVSGGTTNQANGIASCVLGGTSNTANGENSNIGGGSSNITYGINSSVAGGQSNSASGDYSSISGGRYNFAKSYGEWVGGLYGTDYIASSIISSVPTDRIFNIGNGLGLSTRSDALTILKNGLATLPSVTVAIITTAGAKAIITKEYADAAYVKVSTVAPLSSGSPGVAGEVRITATYIYTCIATNVWVRTAVETF